MSTFQGEDQFDTALLLTMREELQALQSQTAARFSSLEDIIKGLADDVKKLIVLRPATQPAEASGPKPAPASSDRQVVAQASADDGEDLSSRWNYIIAQKGGYNQLLSVTLHELLELGEEGIAFLAFLAQERELEVQSRLRQLQDEYQRLQGNQLQEHFQELWKSHYTLLKHKQARTWKEEIFLAAFDAFIAWIQT